MVKKKRKSNGYVTMKIPEGLAKKIDKSMKIDGSYTSRTDYVKMAVRDLHSKILNEQKKR